MELRWRSLEACAPFSAQDAKHTMQEYGVCWMADVLDLALLERLAAEARLRFDELLQAVARRHAAETAGLPEPLHRLSRLPVQTAEVVERDGGRFDCRHGLDELRSLLDSPSKLVESLKRILGPDLAIVSHGQVVALSVNGREAHACADGGDGAQLWHADGPHLFEDQDLPAHAVTIFFPIAEVTAAAGPTEFALGTHKHGHGLPEKLAAREGEAPEYVRAVAPAGSAILFDYRTWHRGLPNMQQHESRHMLYLVVARPWWRDDRNHLHTTSIFAEAEEGDGEEEDDDVKDESAAPRGRKRDRE